MLVLEASALYLCTMVQEILIGFIFLAALGFLAYLIFRSFTAKEGCSTGCGACTPADFKKMDISSKEEN